MATPFTIFPGTPGPAGPAGPAGPLEVITGVGEAGALRWLEDKLVDLEREEMEGEGCREGWLSCLVISVTPGSND